MNKFFESRYHAYSGISRYFYLSALINIGLGTWGMISPDCPSLNPIFVEVLWICCYIEAVVAVLVGLGISTLMKTRGWAGFALCSISFYGIIILAKTAYIVLASILVGKEIAQSIYLITLISAFGFHLICGSWFVLGIGFDDAIEEAIFHFSRPDKEKIEEGETQTKLLR